MAPLNTELLDALCEIDNITLSYASNEIKAKFALGHLKYIKPEAKQYLLDDAKGFFADKKGYFLVLSYNVQKEYKTAFFFKGEDIEAFHSGSNLKDQDKWEFLQRLSQEMADSIKKTFTGTMGVGGIKLEITPQQTLEDWQFSYDDFVVLEMQLKINDSINSFFWHIMPAELGEAMATEFLNSITGQQAGLEAVEKEESEEASDVAARKTPINKVMVDVYVRLCEKEFMLKELWQLDVGSTMAFDRSIRDKVDIYTENALIGKGKVVKIGDKFGVKFLEVNSYGKGAGS